MEPITLCGLVIVMFGLWVELEPAVRAVGKLICKSKFIKNGISNWTCRQKPVYVSRMPICLAKAFY
jgi:hypothetical protein